MTNNVNTIKIKHTLVSDVIYKKKLGKSQRHELQNKERVQYYFFV